MTALSRLLILLCVALFPVTSAHAQRAAEVERVAALRYAIANGFQIPASTIVARETVVDSTRPRSPATRVAQRDADASALAAEAGPSARAGSAAGAVTCRRRVCWATASQRVLVVSDPEYTPQDRTVVGLTLYERNADGHEALRGAVVVLRRTEGGWVGVSYSVAPFSVRTRLPY